MLRWPAAKLATAVMLFDQRKPPEAVRRSPVTQAESSEARNTATLAMSSGWPMRASGVRRTRSFSNSLPMTPMRVRAFRLDAARD